MNNPPLPLGGRGAGRGQGEVCSPKTFRKQSAEKPTLPESYVYFTLGRSNSNIWQVVWTVAEPPGLGFTVEAVQPKVVDPVA